MIDKITMSAFEGTPLDIVLRDCGVRTYLIVGVALEVGIEPTVRHSAILGYVPIVVRDACGSGDAAAGEPAGLRTRSDFAGDAIELVTRASRRNAGGGDAEGVMVFEDFEEVYAQGSMACATVGAGVRSDSGLSSPWPGAWRPGRQPRPKGCRSPWRPPAGLA